MISNKEYKVNAKTFELVSKYRFFNLFNIP